MDARERAVAELAAKGVSFDGGHGSVEELKDYIARATAVSMRQKAGRVFSAERQCARKVKYASPDAAKKAARRGGNPEVREYRCGHCGSWHNGNPPKRRA